MNNINDYLIYDNGKFTLWCSRNGIRKVILSTKDSPSRLIIDIEKVNAHTHYNYAIWG